MKKKILLVEDDLFFANVYRNKLLVEGFEVETAHDGEAGFQALSQFRPDVILVDLILPKVSGVELIRKIRAQPDFKDLPIIVFSNTYLTSLVQDAWKAGATKCLAKASCSPGQVIATLYKLVNDRKDTDPARPAVTETATAQPEEVTLSDLDEQAQLELRKTYAESLPATLTALRAELKNMAKGENEAARLRAIDSLYQLTRTLTGGAGVVGLLLIAQLTDALEALLKGLLDEPKQISPSTMRTVASAVDFLGILFQQGTEASSDVIPDKVLVVDDEPISRRAITNALDKARLKHVSIANPLDAFKLLGENRFCLIFLDVDMPEMNGFELCTKIRAMPAYKTTPVVFITGLNDFESRTNSTMSGGNDFIAKPFMFIELAVRALIYVLRSQLQPFRHPPAVVPARS